MQDGSHVPNPREIGSETITTTSIITDDITNTMYRVLMYVKDKNRKIDVVYASGSWMAEDSYGIMKVKELNRNHVFKNLKFVKGEGRRALTTNVEKKNANILQYGNCCKNTDLTRTNRY